MRNFEKLKLFLTGMLCMALILVPNTTIYAQGGQMIEAFYSGIKIYIDDTLVVPTDANGDIVEPFIYNGTTYLPVRAVANAFEKAVTWDGKTKSVYLGVHNSDEPRAYLYQLDYFDRSSDNVLTEWDAPRDNYGKYYSFGVYTYGNGYITYNLNSQYNKMTGKFVINYDERDGFGENILKIYGDDKVLFTSPGVTAGSDPIDLNIDLTGVNKLKIEIELIRKGTYSKLTGLVDVAFY